MTEAKKKPKHTHRFLSGKAGKEPALISVMWLLLRSSVSRARKGPSCSVAILDNLLFALKTQTPTLHINDKIAALSDGRRAPDSREGFPTNVTLTANCPTPSIPTILLFTDVLFCL